MKKNARIKTLTFITGVFLTTSTLAASLDVKLDGFQNDKGQVLVFLHNKPDFFPTQPDKAVSSKIVKIQNKTAHVRFDDIKPGVYALSIVHDENNNGKLETNFLGIPKESVGTSNNVRGRFGPPSFKDASFKLEEDTQLFITMH